MAALLAVLLGLAGGGSAQALATYRTVGEVTVELSGGPLDAGILRIADTYSINREDDNDPAFPSFVTPESEVTFGPDGRSLRLRVASTGAANYAGGADSAAEGLAAAGGIFGVVNPTDLGFLLDVSVRGSFQYAASVDDGFVEAAGTSFSLSHYGSVLEGLHDPTTILSKFKEVRPPLMPTRGALAFDLATTTFLLGAQETYSVLIPPSFVAHESDHEVVIEIAIHEVGFLLQAGGRATSLLGGATSLVLDDGPPGPDPVDPKELPRPHFQNRPPVPSCLEPVDVLPRPGGKTLRVAPGQDLYRLWAEDDVDPAPRIFLTDPHGAGPYGPFAPGDLVRIQQRPDRWKGAWQARGPRKGAPWGLVENVFLENVAIVTAVDVAGMRATIQCPLPPRPPKDGQGLGEPGAPSPQDGR